VITLLTLAVLHLASSSAQVPYREPQLASSAKLVALAYGAGNAIYVQTSSDQGRSFAAPVKVADLGVLPLGRHRGPRIVFSKSTIVVTAVAGNVAATGGHAHGLASDGDLYAWRSTDGGKTWSKGVRVDDVAAAAHEGLHTLAADGRGNVFAAWLDLRSGGTELYGAFSHDSGATWSRNIQLYKSPDGHICECCHPSASYARNGRLDVMWRNCLNGSRDFYLMRSADGKRFSQPEKLGEGTWKINACPMDGGGVTHPGHRTVTAWRREADIYLAEPGRPETKIGEGKDVALAASGKNLYAAWVAGDQLIFWTNGKTESVAGPASFPALTGLPGPGALAAWEANGGIAIERLGEK